MRVLAVLAAMLLAAGCMGRDPDDPLQPAAASPSSDAPMATPAEPPGPAPSEGSPGTDEAANASAPAPRVVRLEGDASFGLAVGHPCPGARCASGFGLRYAPLEIPEASPTKATLVATWNASSPAGERLAVSLRPEDDRNPVSAIGASPLTLEVPPAFLARAGKYLAWGEPDAPGVMVEQTIHVTLTLQYG